VAVAAVAQHTQHTSSQLQANVLHFAYTSTLSRDLVYVKCGNMCFKDFCLLVPFGVLA
jgi:hypothetical protein